MTVMDKIALLQSSADVWVCLRGLKVFNCVIDSVRCEGSRGDGRKLTIQVKGVGSDMDTLKTLSKACLATPKK